MKSVYLDNAIKSFTRSLFVPLGIFRDWMLIYFLMPLKAVFQSMPWTGVILFVGAIGWKLGKMRLALTVMLFVFFIASSGYWVRAMITVYMVFASLIICALIGIPLGIFPHKGGQRHSGWIMPAYGESKSRGQYIDGLGFYWAPNDYWDYGHLRKKAEQSSF